MGRGGLQGRRTGLRRREDRGAGRKGISGAGRALRNPGTGERARPLGAEKARAKLRGGGNPFRARGLYLSDGERGIKKS